MTLDPSAIERGKQIAQSIPGRAELMRQLAGDEAAAATNLEAFAVLAIHGGAKTDTEAADSVQAFVTAFQDEKMLNGFWTAAPRLVLNGKLRTTALIELVCGCVNVAHRLLPADALKVLAGASLACKDGGTAALETLLGMGNRAVSDSAIGPDAPTTNVEPRQDQERS